MIPFQNYFEHEIAVHTRSHFAGAPNQIQFGLFGGQDSEVKLPSDLEEVAERIPQARSQIESEYASLVRRARLRLSSPRIVVEEPVDGYNIRIRTFASESNSESALLDKRFNLFARLGTELFLILSFAIFFIAAFYAALNTIAWDLPKYLWVTLPSLMVVGLLLDFIWFNQLGRGDGAYRSLRSISTVCGLTANALIILELIIFGIFVESVPGLTSATLSALMRSSYIYIRNNYAVYTIHAAIIATCDHPELFRERDEGYYTHLFRLFRSRTDLAFEHQA
jgi:hypothetical protein